MRKMNLFLAIAGMCATTSVMAQTDVTPSNWKFDGMKIGSADQLFIREAAAIGGNFQAGTQPDGRKGYRWGDNRPGALSVSHWTGEADSKYENMSEEQKSKLEAFYKAFRIADGGALGKILIYQGNASSATDLRAQKNTVGMVAPNIYLVSDYKTMSGTTGIYKISIPIRFIVNSGVSAELNTLIGDSWWNGAPLAGSGGSDYGNFKINGEFDVNDFWTLYEFEIEVKNNTDSKFDFWPLLIKFGFNGVAANQSIVMFDDFKIEKMPAISLGGKVKVTDVDWSDTPTNISNTENTENLIILTNENGIQVIDAKSTIEVYNAAGKLIQEVKPTSSATTIAIDSKGVYMVKTGQSTQKVIF